MKALVTGALGQDGTLLSRLLRSAGNQVLGVDRVASENDGCEVMGLDISDPSATEKCVREFRPDRIFHPAACHHSSDGPNEAAIDERMVSVNFRSTETSTNVVARHLPQCRLLFAGSSQMYTPTAPGTIVNETTPMRPTTFYGWTKAWSRELLTYYREHRSVYAVTAILFNHESVLRGSDFITRKVTMAAAMAKLEGKSDLNVRDISAAVDWSAAEDIVEGMMIALSADEPRDYVIASGATHTVEDLLNIAFARVELPWRDFVSHDAVTAGARPSLVGDATRLRSIGWAPRIGLKTMIETMVDADLSRMNARLCL